MLPVPQDHSAHITHTGAVHEDLSGGDSAVFFAGLSGQFKHGADLTDVDVPAVHAHGFCQPGVELQVPLLAVEGQEELGLHQSMDDLQFFLASVAGNMEAFALFVHHIGTLAVQLVDDAGHGLLVTGNGGRGNDDPVTSYNVHLLVGIESHAVQGGHVLTLASGGHDDHLVFGQALDGTQVYNRSAGDLQIAQLLGNLQHILHASSGDSDFPSVAVGAGDDGLEPVHIGCEGGDDDALVAVFELALQAFGDGVFAGGDTGTVHIGGIAHQGQNALVAQFTQPGQIGHAVLGGGVDLEVAGEDQGAYRGVDREGHRVGDGVVHMNEFHGEAAGLDHITGLVGHELDGLVQIMLFQLQPDQA